MWKFTGQVTCWSRADRPATNDDVFLLGVQLSLQKLVDLFSVVQYLLRSLSLSGCVDTISWIFYTQNIQASLLYNPVHQRLRQTDVFAISMEMDHDFLGRSLKIKTGYEVLRRLILQFSLLTDQFLLSRLDPFQLMGAPA